MPQQDQGVDVVRPEKHLEVRSGERIDAVLDNHGLVGERLDLGND